MHDLPQVARYLPFASGRYEVKAGLHKLGRDFGNGDIDGKVFQIDNTWPQYRQAKLAARERNIRRYVCSHELQVAAERHLAAYLCTQLIQEYPEYFHWRVEPDQYVLQCKLSAETLYFDRELVLLNSDSVAKPAYISALDALACQIQEDLAFMGSGESVRLRWLHLCFPNHWAATDKIGKDFTALHEPVADMERINARAQGLVSVLARQGPNVRFAWGLASDPELDRHPGKQKGRTFSEDGPLWIRVERQVTVPIVKYGFLFTIRTYMIDSASLDRQQAEQLRAAIETMSLASRRYKGIAGHERAILAALKYTASQERT